MVVSRILLLSFLTALSALYSCVKPMMALMTTIVRMAIPSTVSPT